MSMESRAPPIEVGPVREIKGEETVRRYELLRPDRQRHRLKSYCTVIQVMGGAVTAFWAPLCAPDGSAALLVHDIGFRAAHGARARRVRRAAGEMVLQPRVFADLGIARALRRRCRPGAALFRGAALHLVGAALVVEHAPRRIREIHSERRREERQREKSYSALAPDEITTLAHFSVSAAITLPKSSGVPLIGWPPRSA